MSVTSLPPTWLGLADAAWRDCCLWWLRKCAAFTAGLQWNILLKPAFV